MVKMRWNCPLMAVFCIMWRQMKWGVTWPFWSCDAVGTSVSTTWHWWHCHLMISSIAPLHLSAQDDQNETKHDLSIIWHCKHWHQYHVMQMTLSIALYSVGKDNWNNMKHNIFGHLMSLMLVSVSCDANIIINGAIPFDRLIWAKGNVAWPFCACGAIGAMTSLLWCQWHHHETTPFVCQDNQNGWHDFIFMWYHWHWCWHYMPMASNVAPLHCLQEENQNKMQHDFLVIWCHWHWHQCHMMPKALSMAPLYSLGQENWNEMQHDFLSCDDISITTGIGIMWCHYPGVNIMWCEQHNLWYHCIPYIKMMLHDFLVIWHHLYKHCHDSSGAVSGTIAFLRSRWSK